MSDGRWDTRKSRMPDKDEICAHMRQTLRPSIVGLSPKVLHVKPLLFGGERIPYYTSRHDYLTFSNSERRKRPLPCVKKSKPCSRELDSPKSPMSYIQFKKQRNGQGTLFFIVFQLWLSLSVHEVIRFWGRSIRWWFRHTILMLCSCW